MSSASSRPGTRVTSGSNSAGEVLEITVIAELPPQGLLVAESAPGAAFPASARWGAGLGDILAGTSDVHLLTDGKSIYLEDRHERVIDILKNARQPMFLISA